MRFMPILNDTPDAIFGYRKSTKHTKAGFCENETIRSDPIQFRRRLLTVLQLFP
jgi:hypothetical protein